MNIGAKVAVINDRRALILATGADLELPTGDETRGLGEGHAAAAPFLLGWIPFGPERRWLFQAATHIDVPLEAGHETHGEASGALSWTLPLGVTPIVEGLASWSFDGGPPSWWVAPEVRWEFLEAWELGAGVRVRVSALDERRLELAFGMIHHFPLP